MISDRKAMRAVETLRVYCDERGCSEECKFRNEDTDECTLQVRSPAYFPKNYDYKKTKQNVNKS